MRALFPTILLLALVAAGCQNQGSPALPGGSAPTDPKALYSMEVSAESAAPGETGSVLIAIRTVEGAEVKEETPFRASLEATGPIALAQTDFDYGDRARVEGGGPVFEFPVEIQGPGEGMINAEMVFFVCMEEACLRTTEQLSIPVN